MGETAEDRVPEVRYRDVVIERDALATRAAGDDSLPVAISSETPVDRPFGREILSHDAAAVDMTYARNGLPLLDNHDTGRQVGLVKDVRIGADRKLRGRLVFGHHPDAGWMRQDFEAGIRGSISVGYRVNNMTLTATDRAAGDTYTVDSWTPMEVSTVPVPADATVGAGRAAGGLRAGESSGGEGRIMSRTTEDIRQEIANIYALASEHGVGPEAAAKAVERGLSRDQFAAEILERKAASAKASPTIGVDLTEREHKRYNLGRAIMAKATGDWRTAGLEMEVHQTLRSGAVDQSRDSLHIPLNVRASVTGNIVSTSSLGGAGVATEIRELVELLRNRITVVQAGATTLFGLQGNLSFPRQITANTLSWTGENPSSGNTLTAATLDNVTMSPKSAMVSTAYSRQLLAQGSFDVSSFIANDLAQVNAVGLDYAALNGVGSSNQPTGIRVQSGITNTTIGTNGGNLAWSHIVGLETSIATANADIGSISFIVTPGVRGKLKTTLQNTTSGAAYIWGPDDRLNGYRAFVTNQLPSNLTKGTSTAICHSVVFGVMSELLVGLWGPSVELLVDPYSYSSQGMIQVHSFLLADIALKHPAGMAKIDDVTLV